MSAHDRPRHVCPYCLKWFETKDGVKAHQKIKRHRVEDRAEGGNFERAMRRYDHDRRAQLKLEKPNP